MIRQIEARVHHKLIIHRVEDDPDKHDGLILSGTMRQFVIVGSNDDVSLDVPDDISTNSDFPGFRFEYRFNDQLEEKGHVELINEPIRTDLVGTNQTVFEYLLRLNKVPLELDVEFDAFPFKLISANLGIRFVSYTPPDRPFCRYVPDLMVHRRDNRNMLVIKGDKNRKKPDLFPRLGESQEHRWGRNDNVTEALVKDFLIKNLDKSFAYDFVSPFPKVAYHYDGSLQFCPRYSVTFLLTESGLRKFIEIVLPMVLIATMNFLNVVNEVRAVQKKEQGDEDYEPVPATDYLGISATLALAVVVLLPNMVSRTQVQALLTVNNSYIVVSFVALTLSSLPHSLVGTSTPAIVGAYLFWASFVFPIFNGIRYLRFKRNWKPKGEFFNYDLGPKAVNFNRAYLINNKIDDGLIRVAELLESTSDENLYNMGFKRGGKSHRSLVLEFCDHLD